MPLGRVGQVDDIASLIRFLAGPESSWMTGVNVPIDGGTTSDAAPTCREPKLRQLDHDRVDRAAGGAGDLQRGDGDHPLVDLVLGQLRQVQELEHVDAAFDEEHLVHVQEVVVVERDDLDRGVVGSDGDDVSIRQPPRRVGPMPACSNGMFGALANQKSR